MEQRALWQSRLSEEIDFWKEAILWPELMHRRDHDMPLQDRMRELLGPKERVHILDVGAGPLTAVGKKWPGREVCITAVDPLAEEYDSILAAHKIIPPVRTTKLCGEDVFSLPPDSFDLTYSRNCLDHSFNPIFAIRAMLHVTKPGGLVLLQHMVREAEHMQGQGLHQWNFYNSGSTFLIESTAGEVVTVNSLLSDYAIVTASLISLYPLPTPQWIEVTMVKR